VFSSDGIKTNSKIYMVLCRYPTYQNGGGEGDVHKRLFLEVWHSLGTQMQEMPTLTFLVFTPPFANLLHVPSPPPFLK